MIAVSYPSGAAALGSISLGIVGLLVIGTWIGLATINSEPSLQGAAVAALQGGVVRYRLALSLSAALAVLALTPLSIGFAAINDPAHLTAAELTVAVLAHLTAALTGVSVGAVVSRPLVNRAGYAFLLAIAVLVVLVAVPGLPPVRLMIELLQAPNFGSEGLSSAVLTTIGTSLAAGLAWWSSATLAGRRV